MFIVISLCAVCSTLTARHGVFSYQGQKEQHAGQCPVSKRKYRYINLAECVTETISALILSLLLIVALSRAKTFPY